MPTRLPETAAKKKPVTSITSAASIAAGDRLGEVEVERDHQHDDRRDAEQHGLEREVALGAVGGRRRRRRLLDVGDAALDAADQVLAHPVERVAGADQHAADGDRPHDVAVEVAGQRRPSSATPVRRRCTGRSSIGPRKKTSSGTNRPQASRPPAKLSAPSSGPMM